MPVRVRESEGVEDLICKKGGAVVMREVSLDSWRWLSDRLEKRRGLDWGMGWS